jgi:hypothetical protein
MLCPKCNVQAAVEHPIYVPTDGSFLANTTSTVASVLSPNIPTVIVEKLPTTNARNAEKPHEGRQILIDTHYKLALLIVAAITVLCFVVLVAFGVFVPSPTRSQEGLLSLMQTAFLSGFGAFLGLIGGKILK